MNNTYRINAQFAVSKALEAVKSWEKALEVQIEAKDEEGIRFCEDSLKACQDKLVAVREDVKNVQNWL